MGAILIFTSLLLSATFAGLFAETKRGAFAAGAVFFFGSFLINLLKDLL